VGAGGSIVVLGSKAPATGLAKAYAGAYAGMLVTPVSTRDHGLLITADGWIMTYSLITATVAEGGVGRISADGTFTLSFVGGGTAVGQVVLNPVTPLITGSYLRNGVLYRFNGAREAAVNDLINISTRGFVGSGASVMIAGFIIQPHAKTVYIRALGPALTSFGVDNALADPVIELYSGANMIASNDNWQSGPDAAKISVRPDKPLDAREPALMATLEPGAYTVILKGKNNTTGNALIEVNQAD